MDDTLIYEVINMQSTTINRVNKLLLSTVLFYAFSVQGVQAGSFRFAAIGDTPYSDEERQSLPSTTCGKW